MCIFGLHLIGTEANISGDGQDEKAKGGRDDMGGEEERKRREESLESLLLMVLPVPFTSPTFILSSFAWISVLCNKKDL